MVRSVAQLKLPKGTVTIGRMLDDWFADYAQWISADNRFAMYALADMEQPSAMDSLRILDVHVYEAVPFELLCHGVKIWGTMQDDTGHGASAYTMQNKENGWCVYFAAYLDRPQNPVESLLEINIGRRNW